MGDRKSTSEPTHGRRLRRATMRLVVVLLIVAIGAGAALVVLLWQNPPTGSLGFEGAKSLMQLLAVAVIGTAIGAVVRARDDDMDFERQEAADRLADDRSDLERRFAEDSKDRDFAADERRQQDVFLSDVIDRTLTAYHAVKRSRRLLDAETRISSDERSITLAQYDQRLDSLIEQQLQFESLARIGDLCNDRVPPQYRTRAGQVVSLTSEFSEIEDYLNDLVKEYRTERYRVRAAEPEGLPLAELHKLDQFVRVAPFRRGTSERVRWVVTAIQAALLDPRQRGVVTQMGSPLPDGSQGHGGTGDGSPAVDDGTPNRSGVRPSHTAASKRQRRASGHIWGTSGPGLSGTR